MRLLAPLLVLFFSIIMVFYVLYRPSKVDGESMEPTLLHGERLLSTKSYDEPHRGDVVVFKGQERSGARFTLIKRIVAVPGDVVAVDGGVATVNGVAETPGGFIADPGDPRTTGPLTVEEGTVFVLGDNRLVSLDSRHFGSIPLKSVAGRVVYVWAPLGRMRAVR